MQETEFRGVPLDKESNPMVGSSSSTQSQSQRLVNVGPKSRRSVMYQTLDAKNMPSNVILTPIMNLKLAGKNEQPD